MFKQLFKKYKPKSNSEPQEVTSPADTSVRHRADGSVLVRKDACVQVGETYYHFVGYTEFKGNAINPGYTAARIMSFSDKDDSIKIDTVTPDQLCELTREIKPTGKASDYFTKILHGWPGGEKTVPFIKGNSDDWSGRFQG